MEIDVCNLVANAGLKLWKTHVHVPLMSSLHVTFLQFKVEPLSNNIPII